MRQSRARLIRSAYLRGSRFRRWSALCGSIVVLHGLRVWPSFSLVRAGWCGSAMDLRTTAAGYIESGGFGSRALPRPLSGDQKEKNASRLPLLTRRSSSGWECVDQAGVSGNHSFSGFPGPSITGLDGYGSRRRRYRPLRWAHVDEGRSDGGAEGVRGNQGRLQARGAHRPLHLP